MKRISLVHLALAAVLGFLVAQSGIVERGLRLTNTSPERRAIAQPRSNPTTSAVAPAERNTQSSQPSQSRPNSQSSPTGAVRVIPNDARPLSQALVDSWKAGDQPAALALANLAIIDALFATPVPRPAPEFEQCYIPDSDSVDCQYSYDGGTLVVEVTNPDGRFVVEQVQFVPW